MDELRVRPLTRPISATFAVPSDKSIAHRAALLAAVAEGVSTIHDFPLTEDNAVDLAILALLGVRIDGVPGNGEPIRIHGGGLHGLREPEDVLHCRNSGTSLRMLAGLLAPQDGVFFLTGDRALLRRPMARISAPLKAMGANVIGRHGGRYAPLAISGARLRGIDFNSPSASAQVKSCLLFAGLSAKGTTEIIEPTPSRDHSERLLEYMGAKLTLGDGGVSIEPGALKAVEIRIPGDVGLASVLFAVAAALPGSTLTIPNLGTNPTRVGYLGVLQRMGAKVGQSTEKMISNEPTADVTVEHGKLESVTISGPLIPRLADELPAIAVAATRAQGVTVVRDAGDLRSRESDRITILVNGLAAMGAKIEATADGFMIDGPCELRGAEVDAGGDHRIATAFAAAALIAKGDTIIRGTGSIEGSFPGFEKLIESLR